jgi:hypothetical protein
MIAMLAFILPSALAFLAVLQPPLDLSHEVLPQAHVLGPHIMQRTTEAVPQSTLRTLRMMPIQGPTFAPPTTACPRPSDQYGLRYQTVTGTLIAHHARAPGGKFVVIQPPVAAAPHAEAVTDAVFDLLVSVPSGTLITLFNYPNAALSSAQPPYSCVEVAGRATP